MISQYEIICSCSITEASLNGLIESAAFQLGSRKIDTLFHEAILYGLHVKVNVMVLFGNCGRKLYQAMKEEVS